MVKKLSSSATGTAFQAQQSKNALGLTVYHVCEPEIKNEVDPTVYDEQVGMMEMVMDVDDIISEMSSIRNEYCKYL